MKIGYEKVTEIRVLRLEPAARVTLKAVDAKTGEGIAGVRFEYETDTTRQRRDLQSQLVIADRPATDESGQLHAIVEPGRRRFFVGTGPWGLKRTDSSSELLDLIAGREQEVRFAFTKAEESNVSAKADATLFPDDLIQKWQRQRLLTRIGKLRVRRDTFYFGGGAIAPDEVERFLDEAELGKTSDPAALLEDRFAILPQRGTIFYELIDDGDRSRNTYRFNQGQRKTHIAVANGLETVSYDSSNAQADVFDPHSGGSVAVHGIAEFCTWPLARQPGIGSSRDVSDVKRTENGDRLTVEWKFGDVSARRVVDRNTGFVHIDSSRSKRSGRAGNVIHQYGQISLHNGAILPQLHIKINLRNDNIDNILVDRIEHADLAYRPDPLDFVIAPPAGTLIIDHREDYQHPNLGTAHYPPADVIAYADGMSSKNRQIEPVLKPGQKAPALQPANWLDRDGPTDPPNLAGKVILVDFWGITCGPCVGQLPDVQAAADHFASKGDQLVLIGLHESGATRDHVAAFARTRSITYPLAIDRAADEDGWFGATFKAYGVRGIPSAAVIDRQGNVVFVGRFNEALQQAATLLEK